MFEYIGIRSFYRPRDIIQFCISIQNKLKKDDLKKYDVVYQYKNGTLLSNIDNFCEGHNNIPLSCSYKNDDEWIYVKKNKFDY